MHPRAKEIEEAFVRREPQLQTGSRVTYIGRNGKRRPERGIVKGFPSGREDAVYVVYYCNEDWDNYEDYTGILTDTIALKLGWDD